MKPLRLSLIILAMVTFSTVSKAQVLPTDSLVPGNAPPTGPGQVAIPTPGQVPVQVPAPGPPTNPINPAPIVDPPIKPGPTVNPGNPIDPSNAIAPVMFPNARYLPYGNPYQNQNQMQNQQGNTKRPKARAFVGTYTGDGSKSQGIYLAEFDPNDGSFRQVRLAAQTASPSFLAIHPSGKFLYAVNELGQIGDELTGSVSSFGVDAERGSLTFLNSVASKGAHPCYVTVDPSGSVALVANYTGGTIAALPISDDGQLRPASSVIHHEGSSVDRARQSSPHAHSIDLAPGDRLAVVADLGLDKLLLYNLDPQRGSLKPAIPPSVPVDAGSGPRHLAFHPDGSHAYLINEMASTIMLFDYEKSRGTFSKLQTISTRPSSPGPGNSTAEIAVHPSGRYLYASNRGDDSLAIYRIDQSSAKLSPVGYQSTGGKTPRFFTFDPSGYFLLVANQDSDTIVVFQIDPSSGKLQPTGQPTSFPKPVCIKFLPGH